MRDKNSCKESVRKTILAAAWQKNDGKWRNLCCVGFCMYTKAF